MKLSNQTFLLIFGVTLAHLVGIAALSPTDQPSRISQPTLFPDEAFVGPADDSAPVPAVGETVVETRPLQVPETEAPADPVDLPARFRELPDAEPAPSLDPVAETRPARNRGEMPRELAPLPRS
ncbi:MAG: hypothetical protein KGR69_04590 [Verrucomicrobia bacterium]|jgi:hypothetical protein|nr:hypothetical protein [Verrucomicrobiota bacterium]